MVCRMLRVAEVADRLSCSERTVRRWIADGTLPSKKIKGIRVISENALDRLIGSSDPKWLEDVADKSDSAKAPVETARFEPVSDAVSNRISGERE